ncbi:MAG: amidohydrolase family protein [Planctomycetes bacterium]|nr:amidohydrolase family protein [Planctomycetota bacterium]
MNRGIRLVALLVVTCCFTLDLPAQTEPREGIERRVPEVHAIIGAAVITEPGEIIQSATILIKDGVITDVGTDVQIPANARVWDRSDHVITAGFIDMDYRVETEAPTASSQAGRNWNAKVHPEHDTAEGFVIDSDTASRFRKAGFTNVLASPDQGIFSGSVIFARLNGGSDRRALIEDDVAISGGLRARRGFGGGYPSSRMGAMALLRQTLIDANWYREAWNSHRAHPGHLKRPESNLSLEALFPVIDREIPLALRTRDVLEMLAIDEALGEFEVNTWYYGNGQEYLWLDEVAAIGSPIILPVNFPETPTVDGASGDAGVTLGTLEKWAHAPENPERLRRAGVPFTFTTQGLDSPASFASNVQNAIERGLPADFALAAVTTEPARLIGVEDRFGRIAAGKTAMLAVFDGSPFEKGKSCVEVWIDGVRHQNRPDPDNDIRGSWQLTFDQTDQPIEIGVVLSGSEKSPRMTVNFNEETIGRSRFKRQGNEIGITLPGEPFGETGFVRFGGTLGVDGQIRGTVTSPSLAAAPFIAIRTGDVPENAAETDTDDQADEAANDDAPPRSARRGGGGWRGANRPGAPGGRGNRAAAFAGRRGGGGGGRNSSIDADKFEGFIDREIPRPLGAFGSISAPFSPPAVLVQGATIWTCGPEGIFEEADLLVMGGKVVEVGQNLTATKGTHVIDGSGLHVTPGLIDPHSHTAIRGGVNEGTQAVTAEVRIGDSVDSEDINIYRQLAGGVTAAQLLHGSANPIGGQSAIVKWRWGFTPEQMKIENAPPMIKFALGENVKRSNWGGESEARYPQTRMGVEQIIRDAFHAANQYKEMWNRWENADRSTMLPPRRDLELDTLVEILEGTRLVHCHSYRQDEILMLMRVAEDFDFTIGTFQHILEGYKVATEMAKHGVSGSTFSDWWAYKFEVYDAIPYNGALMRKAGVNVSFNSDSDELARRLNLEAAKAVKYGDVPPEEALKFVTLNPAYQLRLDDRIGSLEPGKDGDFVIWSGDPLSGYSLCLQTWIEGQRFFDRNEDLAMRQRDKERRESLISIILDSQLPGARGPRNEENEEEGGR